MKFIPLQSIGTISFGANQDSIQNSLGSPISAVNNRLGETEWDYGEIVVRFDGTANEVAEVTTNLKSVELNGIQVPFAHLDSFVKAHDSTAFERVGFIVSPLFGIAFDSHFPCWVTAFSSQRLEMWRAIHP